MTIGTRPVPIAARRRILVLVGEASEELGHVVASCVAGEPADVLAVSPIIPTGRLGRWGIVLSAAERDAKRRLAESIASLEEHGLSVRGHVGAPDPVLAVVDALHGYRADALVVAGHPGSGAGWPEQRLLDQARRFRVPTSHFVARAALPAQGSAAPSRAPRRAAVPC